jgi:hypothetical protein
MPTPPAKKTLGRAILAGLAADGGSLATCDFRLGRQHGWKRGSYTALVVLNFGPAGSETPAGSHNAWWQDRTFTLTVLVPEDPSDASGTEDLRLDLSDQIETWVHNNRTLLSSAKSAHIAEEDHPDEAFIGDEEQSYRAAVLVVSYSCLRSE